MAFYNYGSYVRSELLSGVTHAFTTRLGGVSRGVYASLNLRTSCDDDREAVRENYSILCRSLGIDGKKMVYSKQVHGTVVRAVTHSDCKEDPFDPVDYEADGLITDEKGLSLIIYTADCIPILLYDPSRRAVGAVHAGWRGTAGGIAGEAVRKMHECYGCDPSDILAAVGPGIGPCCFETDADVPETVRASMGCFAGEFVEQSAGGKYHVDLKGINAWFLMQNGVPEGNIEISTDCTACMPERYWSHRVTKGIRGVQGAVIAL